MGHLINQGEWLGSQWLKLAFLLMVVTKSAIVIAESGADCVTTGLAKRSNSSARESRYIESRCSDEVRVFWCVEGEHRSACQGPKLYRQSRSLKPGERYFNQHNLLATGSIRLGACLGNLRSVLFSKDGSGAYACQPVARAVAMIDCGNGTGPFESTWSIRAVRRNGPVLSFQTVEEERVIPLGFDEFSSLEDGDTPEKVAAAFCGQTAARQAENSTQEFSPLQATNELKTRFRDHHNALFEGRVEVCRKQEKPDDECRRILNSLRNTYRGSPVSR